MHLASCFKLLAKRWCALQVLNGLSNTSIWLQIPLSSQGEAAADNSHSSGEIPLRFASLYTQDTIATPACQGKDARPQH